LKFKSTLSHSYKDYTEQYAKIDEGYTIENHTFEKEGKDVEEIVKKIEKLGAIISKSHAMKISRLDVSKPDGDRKFTEKPINYARGYKFSLKQPFRLHCIRIQSDYIGQHVGFVVNDADIVISNGTVNSNDSTMKWLTIPLQCEIKDNYTVLVWAPSDNGSYAYKDGNNQLRAVNDNCSVESKSVQSAPQTSRGSKISISGNTYSIEMILNIEQ
jgi:hypothetical protein